MPHSLDIHRYLDLDIFLYQFFSFKLLWVFVVVGVVYLVTIVAIGHGLLKFHLAYGGGSICFYIGKLALECFFY